MFGNTVCCAMRFAFTVRSFKESPSWLKVRSAAIEKRKNPSSRPNPLFPFLDSVQAQQNRGAANRIRRKSSARFAVGRQGSDKTRAFWHRAARTACPQSGRLSGGYVAPAACPGLAQTPG